jgi:hypothetical protein
MLLAKARGELISLQKAVLQASYLVRSLQQKIWYFPARYGNEILRALSLDQSRQQELNGVLKKVASEFMESVRELPRCVEEGWLETLADDRGFRDRFQGGKGKRAGEERPYSKIGGGPQRQGQLKMSKRSRVPLSKEQQMDASKQPAGEVRNDFAWWQPVFDLLDPNDELVKTRFARIQVRHTLSKLRAPG